MRRHLLAVVALPLFVIGCASDMGSSAMKAAAAPEAVRPPAEAKWFMLATGVGEITYECRARADGNGYEWAFAGPVATLYSGGRPVGKYYGGPTWESSDGSKVGGKQLAVAPAGPGNIPLQLVKAEPGTGSGAMSGVSYIQRLNTKGGVAPAAACGMANRGARQQVAYEADYHFYR